MSATNELDAVLCHESVPDEFSRLASSAPPEDKPLAAFVVSGIVPGRQQDGVMCPLMLRRRLIVPSCSGGFLSDPGLHH